MSSKPAAIEDQMQSERKESQKRTADDLSATAVGSEVPSSETKRLALMDKPHFDPEELRGVLKKLRRTEEQLALYELQGTVLQKQTQENMAFASHMADF